MNIEHHSWRSTHLDYDMEFNVYGDDGKIVIVFPTTNGKFTEYETCGMVDACQPFIENGEITLITVDSIDNQSWLNYNIHPDERAQRYVQYDHYIMEEIVPFAREHGTQFPKMMVTGCDIGATHAANFFFKHPDTFDTLVALSGMYHSHYFLGDFMDDQTYFHFPLVYLPNLTDPTYLNQYQESQIIFCVGRGPWEQDFLKETWAMKKVLHDKGIPAWVDFWGEDVSHDWGWWQKQIVYFLRSLPFTAKQ